VKRYRGGVANQEYNEEKELCSVKVSSLTSHEEQERDYGSQGLAQI